MYIAHKREDGQIQLLSEHLKGTAQRAAEFAHAFGAEKRHAVQDSYMISENTA